MNNKQLEECTIFLTIVGSKAYGTSTPESDTDVRGVCIPKDKTYYVGMGINKFEQQDKGWQDDRVIYDLRKAINLMADGNPNMIDLLFTEEKHWLKMEQPWVDILVWQDKFISKRMRYTYGGYAFAQLHRIQRHRGYLINPPKKKPERSDFGLPDKKVLGAEDLGAVQWLLANYLENTVQWMNFSDDTKAELKAYGNFIGTVQSNLSSESSEEQWKVIQKVVGASDEFISFMMKEKAYLNAMHEWTSYQNWNSSRNEKRRVLESKFGYDTKHAMHLVRLMRMAMEILETGSVLVARPDAEELLSIRNGAWLYDKLVEYANDCEKKLDELYKTSTLPHSPDRKFVDELCQEIIEEYVFG